MKILAFVDIHESQHDLKAIAQKAKQADLLLCAGDLSIFSQNLGMLLDFLSTLDKETLIIHGNHEEEEQLQKLVKRYKNLTFFHKQVIERHGYHFLGFGGGGFSREDEEFESWAREQASSLKNKKIILVTHAPPYGTQLDLIGKKHAGNKHIQEFILSFSPIFAISGHLHENAGKQSLLGKTILLNPGPLGKIIELP